MLLRCAHLRAKIGVWVSNRAGAGRRKAHEVIRRRDAPSDVGGAIALEGDDVGDHRESGPEDARPPTV